MKVIDCEGRVVTQCKEGVFALNDGLTKPARIHTCKIPNVCEYIYVPREIRFVCEKGLQICKPKSSKEAIAVASGSPQVGIHCLQVLNEYA